MNNDYFMETPPNLWNEILRLHWDFLDSEEDSTKLEKRKNLEACIVDFLSVVPHDRKFFLPETSRILKESILQMNNFSAHNAVQGFESISEYANNLCSKSWRKEYREIKVSFFFFFF